MAPRRECNICARSLGPSAFPRILPTASCSHERNTCRMCLRQWIESRMESNTIDQMQCPACPAKMEKEDTRDFVTDGVYRRLEEMELRARANSTPDWRWCIEPGCKGGQVHIPKQNKKQNDIFTCHTCGGQACVRCDRPWHRDKTCQQFQQSEKARLRAEAATKKTIQEICKQCPNCKKNIQRSAGCDHMHCTQCSCDFCWRCLKTDPDILKEGHGERCTNARAGAIDPYLPYHWAQPPANAAQRGNNAARPVNNAPPALAAAVGVRRPAPGALDDDGQRGPLNPRALGWWGA